MGGLSALRRCSSCAIPKGCRWPDVEAPRRAGRAPAELGEGVTGAVKGRGELGGESSGLIQLRGLEGVGRLPVSGPAPGVLASVLDEPYAAGLDVVFTRCQ